MSKPRAILGACVSRCYKHSRETSGVSKELFVDVMQVHASCLPDLDVDTRSEIRVWVDKR
eukprot:scaffold614_cov378-Pavlova_lutheri.AAC.2